MDEEPNTYFWIVQASSFKGIEPYGVCKVNVDARPDIVHAIAMGGIVDKQSAEWNSRLVNTIMSHRISMAVAASGKEGAEAEALMCTLAQAAVEDGHVHVRVPIRLLRISLDAPHEGDIQERVIFQMLHAWNHIDVTDRNELLSVAFEEELHNVSAAATLTEMSSSTSSTLVDLLFRARAVHMARVVASCPTPHKHGVKHRTVIAQAGRVCTGTGCECGVDNYMTMAYERWHSRGPTTEVDRLLQIVPCAIVQRVLVSTLYAVWEGIRKVMISRSLKAEMRQMSIRLIIPPTAHPLLNGTATAVTIECTYKPLREALVLLQRFTSGEQADKWNKGFSVPLDGPAMRLFPVGDPVLTRWCTTLQNAANVCASYPRAMKEFKRMLREWDGGVAAGHLVDMQPLLLGVAQSFMFYRNVQIACELEDEPVDTAGESATWMTFGLSARPDPEWRANNARIEEFINALSTFRAEVRERLCRELLTEPKAPAGRRKPAPAPPTPQRRRSSRLPIAPPSHRMPDAIYEDRSDFWTREPLSTPIYPWWTPAPATPDHA